MKKILIINGNPKKESLSSAMTQAYAEGAEFNGAVVEILNLNEINFTPTYLLGYGSMEVNELVINLQEKIKWAEHIVWIYPTWWYSPTAMLKNFIEQVMLPGFAFKYKENPYRVTWDSYLKGRTAHIISTMDAPPFFYKLWIGNPGGKMMKAFLKFVGIKPIRQTYFGSVKNSKEDTIKKWIEKVKQLGQELK